jgi:hypothetical protein
MISGQNKIIKYLASMLDEKHVGDKKKDEKSSESQPLDVVTLLSLPDNIRKTAYALSKLGGQASAEEVSEVTERTRAIESSYLNQLDRMGYIGRKRDGHKVIYIIP